MLEAILRGRGLTAEYNPRDMALSQKGRPATATRSFVLVNAQDLLNKRSRLSGSRRIGVELATVGAQQ